ncbi:unnamed protein product [Rotaria sordida]|uniref:RING-type domain-containing protein n=1 Tax=Rotaria sordida TaxID=392033 RepID=A0A820BI64_9BILA|nr:unnamed protein product [Rotaria sordida]
MVGVDARNKRCLDTKYICHACSLILRDPVQLLACGHRYCQTCLNIEQEETIKCQQCQSETLRNHAWLDRGFKNDMNSLPINCSFCQWTDVLNNYQKHLDQSHSNIRCEDCGEQFNSVNKFNEHKVSKCQQLIVNCILKEFGCNARIIRAKMEDHYLTKQHQHAVLNVIRQMLSQLNNRQMDIDLPRTTTAGAYNPPTNQLEELYEMLNILVGGIETLTNDEQRLSNELLQMQMILPTRTENLSKVKLSIEESNVFVEAVKHNQAILNQDVLSLSENLNNMQYVSYDGTSIWKITNFREKMNKIVKA